MLLIKKINHRNADQILINWKAGNNDVIQKIKDLPGIRYSKSYMGYYLPCNNVSWQLLKALDVKISIKTEKDDKIRTFYPTKKEDNTEYQKLVNRTISSSKDANINKSQVKKPHVEFVNNRFIVEIPYRQAFINKFKTLDKSYWSGKYKKWICKGTMYNLEELQAFFHFWNEEKYAMIKEMIYLAEFPQKLTIFPVPNSTKYVAIKLVGRGVDVDYIKGILGRKYDREYKRWLIPFDKLIIDRLLHHFKNKNVPIVNRLPHSKGEYHKWEKSHGEKQKLLIEKYPVSFRQLVELFSHAMILQRYSWSTIKAYTASIVRFQTFMGSFDISGGDAKDVNRYLAHIGHKKVSCTEINRHCSAIKFYYSKVLYRPDFELEKIKRPRKTTTLPKVLSRSQIKLLFEQVENAKHLCMLYLLYNGGLRSGELISVRLQDLQWDRSQLFIEGGKGKKDRVVMLGEVMKEMLQDYVDEYNPSYWLFEGQRSGMPYSAASLRKIVKRAAKRAGITQKVTTHTIRHCFATHLLESGTNIRLIQELLGHADIKTTLVYTHVSQASATSVVSPLDSLKQDENE